MAEISISYPVETGLTGKFNTNTLFLADESQIQLLFDTMRGERAIFKTFGNRLQQLIGMNRTKELDNRIKNAVALDIKENLPNIESQEVEVIYHSHEKKYEITIRYSNRVTGTKKQASIWLTV